MSLDLKKYGIDPACLGPETRAILLAIAQLNSTITNVFAPSTTTNLSQTLALSSGKLKAEFIAKSIATATNFLSADIITEQEVARLRVFVILETATALNMRIGRNVDTATAAEVGDFNESIPLGIDDMFIFDVIITREDRINFRHGGAGTVVVARVVQLLPSVEDS